MLVKVVKVVWLLGLLWIGTEVSGKVPKRVRCTDYRVP